MFQVIRQWILDWAEREKEIEASRDLEWRLFAQKHNAAGKRPRCWYEGMPPDPLEKLELQDEEEVEPEYLQQALWKQGTEPGRRGAGSIVENKVSVSLEEKLNKAKGRLG